jgi:hypothetical protein
LPTRLVFSGSPRRSGPDGLSRDSFYR